MTKTRSVLLWSVAILLVSGSAIAIAASGCSRREATSSGGATQAQFVNDRCPIMGNPIDAANVPASLTREYKGRKVAFCCSACPAAWDKLSDKEKDEKLMAVLAPKEHPESP